MNDKDVENFLHGLSLYVGEDVVRKVVDVLQSKGSLYRLYHPPGSRVTSKGTAGKIKKLLISGQLNPYLDFLSSKKAKIGKGESLADANLVRSEGQTRDLDKALKPEAQVPQTRKEIAFPPQEQRRHRQHIKSLLILLEAYIGQLRETYEPEDFITQLGKEALSQKEFDYWYYAKMAVPSLAALIDSQIDAESLVIIAKLESEPSFAALKAVYQRTKLWQDIKGYKKLRGQYWSIGIKLHRTIERLCRGIFAEGTEAEVFRNSVTGILNEDLAPIRVKLQLDGIIDKSVVLDKLPSGEIMSIQRGKELLEKDLSNVPTKWTIEEAKLLSGLLDLLERLEKTYETLRRLEKCIIIWVEDKKLKGTLLDGTN